MEERMMKQAASQIEVAQFHGWNLEWHFADQQVANYMREQFREKGWPIEVRYTQPTQDMTDRFGRVLEGALDELRYRFGLHSRQGHTALQARGL
jgi:hypothetical protein